MIADMNETAVALVLLLLVLAVATVSSRTVALAASLVVFICYNFFVLPPVGTFRIASRDDLVALFVLLAVSLIGSHLSHQARRRAEESLHLERQRNEAEMARRSAEVKSALVASLSHDVKTPLTALTLAAGNLTSPGLPVDLQREQLQIIDTELARLKRLFDNMIDLASVESHTTAPQQEWVMASDIIEAARRQAAATLDAHPVHVRDETTPHLLFLDPRLTSSALAHVLQNAGTYSPSGTPIEIAVIDRSNRLAISVRDHGPGIPANDLPRIFERFYRGSGTDRHSFRQGMGLAITRGLLDLQGGRIVAANHPNGGAVFTLEVPTSTRSISDVTVEVA
jgi:two-component system sensor histidine kinase KdpD